MRAMNQNTHTTPTKTAPFAEFTDSPKMPLLFLGHGSPMSALVPDIFTANIAKISQQIPQPAAIVCISAHWQTRGSFVTAMQNPKTIHDFYGFPPALYAEQYPAKGSPQLARAMAQYFQNQSQALFLDEQQWGLDHGTWCVLKYLYPDAQIPVLQLSLDIEKSPQAHYQLGQQLQILRRKGVLIIGSGNIVHNLRHMSRAHGDDYGYDWALLADEEIKTAIDARNHEKLLHIHDYGAHFQLAIPSSEHYLPLLYILSCQEPDEAAYIFNDQPLMGSLTMTSVALGLAN